MRSTQWHRGEGAQQRTTARYADALISYDVVSVRVGTCAHEHALDVALDAWACSGVGFVAEVSSPALRTVVDTVSVSRQVTGEAIVSWFPAFWLHGPTIREGSVGSATLTGMQKSLPHWCRFSFPLAAVVATGCVVYVDDHEQSTFTVVNRSDYELWSVYVAHSDRSGWGPNLLRHDVLLSGESLTVEVVGCDFYDVRVVDEDRVTCDMYGVYLCDEDNVWFVTNDTLNNCAQ